MSSVVTALTQPDPDRAHVTLDDDAGRWPWLALPPDHPALVGQYGYYVGVAVGEVLQTLPAGMASATTRVAWQTFAPGLGGGPACAALVAGHDAPKGRLGYQVHLLGRDEEVRQRIVAEGAVFRSRDFAAWREVSRRAQRPTAPESFGYATPADAGVAQPVACFVSPLSVAAGGGLAGQALCQAARSFMPAHPWHMGSGDHVNAPQLLDVAWQVAHLVGRHQGWWPADPACLGGEARFRRYVELDVAMSVTVTSSKAHGVGRRLVLGFGQADPRCALITLDIAERTAAPDAEGAG